ncbi:MULTISPECIES: Smr/MutS family protein [Geobacter]|uniref:DNA mismatch repair protein MutS n=2 Tax=Geobacter TaxID=28231 RepID=A0A0C1QT70_9BACT|nr:MULTISPECIES: Smr/MutS family protein [Geobacter]KIE44192.1 DNA mismatch repair protein MutS [Geobacter soli]MBE2887063.1 Smr/MutS family protein [Geobacter anodireducens]HMN03470.1 Smr/MutS family protein [Geobacter anodireducens]
MKKKSPQSGQKKNEFSPSPFSGLKGFRPEPATPEKTPPTVAPPPPRSMAEPDDLNLFLREMAGVRRMDRPDKGQSAQHQRKEPAGPARAAGDDPAKSLEAADQAAFAEAIARLKLDVNFRESLPGDSGAPRPVSRLRQLKNGQIRIDLELDLHGLTREEAVASLERFIAGAHRRGQKAVLVITGKGNNSSGEPVLQGAVLSWLRERGKGMVAEFAPAPRDMGGSGAVVVFLRTMRVKAG